MFYLIRLKGTSSPRVVPEDEIKEDGDSIKVKRGKRFYTATLIHKHVDEEYLASLKVNDDGSFEDTTSTEGQNLNRSGEAPSIAQPAELGLIINEVQNTSIPRPNDREDPAKNIIEATETSTANNILPEVISEEVQVSNVNNNREKNLSEDDESDYDDHSIFGTDVAKFCEQQFNEGKQSSDGSQRKSDEDEEARSKSENNRSSHETSPGVDDVDNNEDCACRVCANLPIVTPELLTMLDNVVAFYHRIYAIQQKKNPEEPQGRIDSATKFILPSALMPGKGKTQIAPNSGLWMETAELEDIKTLYRKKPKELVRKMMKSIIGKEHLSMMTPTGKGNSIEIPKRVYDAVKSFMLTNVKRSMQLDSSAYLRCLTVMCNTIRYEDKAKNNYCKKSKKQKDTHDEARPDGKNTRKKASTDREEAASSKASPDKDSEKAGPSGISSKRPKKASEEQQKEIKKTRTLQ